MTFYTFRQNNNGGQWVGPIVVCVEADGHDAAVAKAEGVGLYFDGEGDCPCCGERWSTYCEESPWPAQYGTPLKLLPEDGWPGTVPWRIHYADGRIEEAPVSDDRVRSWTDRSAMIGVYDRARKLGEAMVAHGPCVGYALTVFHSGVE